MARHRPHSVAFRRQVAQEFVAGGTLHALSKRHDISRQLIRIWVGKFEAGAFGEDEQDQPVHGRPYRHGSTEGGDPEPGTRKGLHPPFGSRLAICVGGVLQAAGQPRPDRLDEPAGQPV